MTKHLPKTAVVLATVLGMLTVLAGCTSDYRQFGGARTVDTMPGYTSGAEQPLISGFTCCNLHYEGDWISDSNYGGLPMVPIGTPAQVTGYGRYRLFGTIASQKMRFGLDYGRSEPLDVFAAKLIVQEDPNLKIATFAPRIQKAIAAGRLVPGMTREQVLMSVGYPQTNETPFLNAPTWKLWTSRSDGYQLQFDSDQLVDVSGTPAALARVLLQP